jgi:hypothetical protein
MRRHNPRKNMEIEEPDRRGSSMLKMVSRAFENKVKYKVSDQKKPLAGKAKGLDDLDEKLSLRQRDVAATVLVLPGR